MVTAILRSERGQVLSTKLCLCKQRSVATGRVVGKISPRQQRQSRRTDPAKRSLYSNHQYEYMKQVSAFCSIKSISTYPIPAAVMSSPLTRLAVVFIASLACCSPLSSSYEPRSLESRGTNCVDPAAAIDSTCWDTLNIAKYLNDPVTGWKKTTPTCTSTDSGVTCCRADEPWSTCFLRLYSGRPGTDCSDITHIENECQLPSPASSLAPSIAASARYVVYAIVSVGRLFESISSGKPSP